MKSAIVSAVAVIIICLIGWGLQVLYHRTRMKNNRRLWIVDDPKKTGLPEGQMFTGAEAEIVEKEFKAKFDWTIIWEPK